MILNARSKSGKILLEHHGTEWVLIRRTNAVHFSGQPGPWYYIQPLEGDEMDARWIHGQNDPKFEVVSRV